MKMCRVLWIALIMILVFHFEVHSQLSSITGKIKNTRSRNTKGDKDSCEKAPCKQPQKAKGQECAVVPKSDKSLPRPTGKYSECCPLWKCTQGSDQGSFFTFHGYEGGTEIVKYTKNASGGTSVSSDATGDHDSSAIAVGGSSGQASGPLDVNPDLEIAKAFRTLGFKFNG